MMVNTNKNKYLRRKYMKKILLISVIVIAFLGGIAGSMYMMSKTQKHAENEEKEETKIADKVTDECVDEYEELENNKIAEANSKEEKLSPNAVITYEKFYKDCEHTVRKYEKIPNSMVNAKRQDIEEKYKDWVIKEFSIEKIVLYKEVDGNCNEHYMLRDVEGKINIYKLDEDGNEELMNETDIATEYLTKADKINMENGLIVYGRESLNKLLEDFE